MSLARYRTLLLLAKSLENESMRKENGDRAKMSLVLGTKWMESKPPPVSIEDCTIIGSVDRGLNSTNRMPGVAGSRNR